MKVSEPIKELENFNPDLEVKFKYSKFTCTGHPEGSYCYCPYEDTRESISYLIEEKNNEYGKKLKVPEILLK